MLVSATATGGVVAGANLLASSLGWWGGHWSYSLPVPLQVCFWVLCLTPLVVLALAGYRWLGSRTHRPRLVYGVILLGVLGPPTAIADAFALNTGRLSFGGGYAIWQDVIVGQALLWFPVLLYELLKPRARPRWSA
ncbi:MAG TPA: hypothetical protein VFX49_01235 [Chloroflexota bacterium]|nr:hypothetical protein [Chloroflexota bacterium]